MEQVSRTERNPHLLTSCAIALLVSGGVVWLQYLVLLHADVPSLGLLYPTMFLVAWYLGFVPAAVAILFTAVAAFYVFNRPYFSFQERDIHDYVRIAIYIFTTGFIAQVIEANRRASRKIRELQRRFEKVSEATDLGVWYSDLPLDKMRWNARSKEHFWLAPEAPVSRDTFQERVHPDDLPSVRQASRDSIQLGKLFDVEYRTVCPSDPARIKWIHAIGWTDFGPNGVARSFDGITLDITELREVARQRDQALLEAREALRTRDEFLSIASHELKTPLTSLHLQLQILGRMLARVPADGYGSRVPEALRLAERQSSRLGHLLEELLDLTRVRLGRLQLAKDEVDLTEITQEIIKRLEPLARQADYLLSIEAPPAVVGHWDRSRIEQVMTNLLSNAIKYGEGRPIHVALEKDEARGTARIRVSDQGMGIAPELRDRIFERFERAISGQNISGLGLGLYITRQIVEAHRGHIWVESGSGLGSTFIVQLPLSVAETEAPAEVR